MLGLQLGLDICLGGCYALDPGALLAAWLGRSESSRLWPQHAQDSRLEVKTVEAAVMARTGALSGLAWDRELPQGAGAGAETRS